MKKIFTLLCLLLALSATQAQVRISQVYGGGGNSAATYNQDFVELFNAGVTPADISGYSVQYASSAGTAWQVVAIPANTTLPAGKYYLVALATGSTGGALPTPDLTFTSTNLSGSTGKVALVNSATALSGATACSDASVVDVVGFGTASCAEGTVLSTSGINNTLSMSRKNNGCTESNNNNADFELLAVSPRNSLSAANLCGSTSPTISASPNISGLSAAFGNPSSAISFNVSAAYLTGAPGNLTATASANLEVGIALAGPFASSVSIPYSSATLATTPVFVRIANTAPLGTLNGTVTVSGGGASTPAEITVAGVVVSAEPNVQASNVVISAVQETNFTVSFTNGNGASRLLVVRQTASPEIAPTDGTIYTVGTNTGNGNTVVYVGNGSGPVSITGLVPGTAYTVKAYEFNGSGGSENYNPTDATANPAVASTIGATPVLAQNKFAGVAVPLYGALGTSTRLPVMYFATVSGLSPNTTYRYYTQAAIASDLGTTNSGAGNPILIDYTANPVTYIYSSGPSLTSDNSYGKFTTNASGTFTGAFGYVNTGNARFTAGNMMMPTIVLGEEGTLISTQYRFALDNTVTVLSYGTTASATEGTFIKGGSFATAGNVAGLWSSVDGNLVAARPLAMTLIENPTFAGAPWAASFVTGYDQTAGSWNTIIPNVNANGVRLIQQFTLAGNVIGCDSDADGTWPDGGANTVNPNGGTTAIVLTSGDAALDGGSCFGILPVNISRFAVQKSGSLARLTWTTAQELNSREFVIERSANGSTFTAIGTVAAAGFSSTARSYNFVDNSPVKGMNFYRIRMVDLDRRFTTTETKTVLFSVDAVLITPNPASSFANIYLTKNDNSITQIFVTDANGKMIERIKTADQIYQLNTSRYAKGLYIIKVVDAGISSTQRLIVQ